VRKRSEYLEIRTHARRVSTSRHVFLIYARDDVSGARLGIIASRKVGNAVVRNRAKRLVREAFRATRALWPDDVDVVVVVRRPPGADQLADLVAEWQASQASITSRVADARRDRARRKSSGRGLADRA
jgi:ribonuclease P protein component